MALVNAYVHVRKSVDIKGTWISRHSCHDRTRMVVKKVHLDVYMRYVLNPKMDENSQ